MGSNPRLFLYKDWLDSFRREVDDELERMKNAPPVASPPPKATPVEEAKETLRTWWEKSYEDPTERREFPIVEASRELELSRKEVAALRAELERARGEQGEAFPSLNEKVRELVAEKAKLEEQLALALREIAGLKEYRQLSAEVDQELGGLRRRMNTIRSQYEARIALLRDQLEGHERRSAAFEAEVRNERERRMAAEKTAEESRNRMAEAEALRAELHAVRSEVEARLSAAAEFLEAKIRGVQDQSKGQANQLRELVEALRRLREG